MALARPGRKDHHDPRAALAGNAVAFARLEGKQRCRAGLDYAPTRLDASGSLDDDKPGPLPNLVIAKLFPGSETDDDCPRTITGLDRFSQARSRRYSDLCQLPGLQLALILRLESVEVDPCV